MRRSPEYWRGFWQGWVAATAMTLAGTLLFGCAAQAANCRMRMITDMEVLP